jgi:hypothetical protein
VPNRMKFNHTLAGVEGVLDDIFVKVKAHQLPLAQGWV